MKHGRDEDDFTVIWQLADRMRYVCVRLPPEHKFRGGEFCDQGLMMCRRRRRRLGEAEVSLAGITRVYPLQRDRIDGSG